MVKIETKAGNIRLNGTYSSWEIAESTLQGIGVGLYIGRTIAGDHSAPSLNKNGDPLNTWEEGGAKYYNFGTHVFKAYEVTE